VKEYDLFIPLFYNDGSPVPVGKFQAEILIIEREIGVL